MAFAVRDSVGMFKVGLELFVQEGPSAVAIGEEAGRPVFLDLKLHDIPETVDRAVARIGALGVRMLTVHAGGGPAMLRRAVERARKEGNGLEIAAVTVLTSFDDKDLVAVGLPRGVAEHVERLATMAWAEGVRTLVCSPLEAARLRTVLGTEATLITPGVRAGGPRSGSEGIPGDDQKRTMSAGEAILAGASWVVVGRPIRDAADPGAVARAIAREIDETPRRPK
ncbi:MAG: orotidine-5'-phosphate decarboxylase [Myxococcota bacterium]|nr:orotidine-5'-phosphate decarboxylase [Myxococcota bacterium]